MNFSEVTGEDMKDATRAYAIATAMQVLFTDESKSVIGAALGVALGDWVRGFGPPANQERAIDKVLLIAARQANRDAS
jgi:hypothetical protein